MAGAVAHMVEFFPNKFAETSNFKLAEVQTSVMITKKIK
jgi:hypothetical protein